MTLRRFYAVMAVAWVVGAAMTAYAYTVHGELLLLVFAMVYSLMGGRALGLWSES